jgi:DNA-binding IscR family transcriptional regulator
LLSSCTIKEPLARVNESIADVLKKIRISDLVDAGIAEAERHAAAAAQLVTLTQ